MSLAAPGTQAELKLAEASHDVDSFNKFIVRFLKWKHTLKCEMTVLRHESYECLYVYFLYFCRPLRLL